VGENEGSSRHTFSWARYSGDSWILVWGAYSRQFAESFTLVEKYALCMGFLCLCGFFLPPKFVDDCVKN